MQEYIKLIRLKHYIKNLLIFLPLIFSGNFFTVQLLVLAVCGFLSFSFAASVVYIINDIRDREKDRLHEKKKERPIASGKITVKNAVVTAVVLLAASLILQGLIQNNWISYVYVLVYVAVNVGYSFGLKDVALLDITILVSGFLIRVLYGGELIDVEVSNWLYLTVMSASFYLGLGKRRNEIIKVGTESRKVLQYYNKSFLDKNMYMCLGLTIVFYSLWSVDSSNAAKISGGQNMLVWTVPVIILILMKYSLNVESDSLGDPVDVVFGDKVLLGLIVFYGIMVMCLLYI